MLLHSFCVCFREVSWRKKGTIRHIASRQYRRHTGNKYMRFCVFLFIPIRLCLRIFANDLHLSVSARPTSIKNIFPPFHTKRQRLELSVFPTAHKSFVFSLPRYTAKKREIQSNKKKLKVFPLTLRRAREFYGFECGQVRVGLFSTSHKSRTKPSSTLQREQKTHVNVHHTLTDQKKRASIQLYLFAVCFTNFICCI